MTSPIGAMAFGSGISNAFGELASASTKDEIAAASRKVAERWVMQLEMRVGELTARVRELEQERDENRERFHKADSETLVLAERLAAIRRQAEMLSRFDWLLTILIALGGAIFGFGVSDLSTGVRIVLAVLGLLLIALPAGFKFRRGSGMQTNNAGCSPSGSPDQARRPQL
jgi:hypothetical protein